jgi:hypothetical protein
MSPSVRPSFPMSAQSEHQSLVCSHMAALYPRRFYIILAGYAIVRNGARVELLARTWRCEAADIIIVQHANVRNGVLFERMISCRFKKARGASGPCSWRGMDALRLRRVGGISGVTLQGLESSHFLEGRHPPSAVLVLSEQCTLSASCRCNSARSEEQWLSFIAAILLLMSSSCFLRHVRVRNISPISITMDLPSIFVIRGELALQGGVNVWWARWNGGRWDAFFAYD